MGDGAKRQYALVTFVLILVEQQFVLLARIGLAGTLHDGKAVPARNQRRAIGEQPQGRRGKHKGDDAGEKTLRIAADGDARDLQHHVAEHAAKAGRQRPGAGRCDAAGDRGGKQRKAEPGQPALAQPVDAARGEEQETPDYCRHQAGDGGKAEELHGEVAENRARIAHGVGDDIVGGVREARIGDVPGGQAGDAESREHEQAGADQPSDLPPRKRLDAVSRVGQRDRC